MLADLQFLWGQFNSAPKPGRLGWLTAWAEGLCHSHGVVNAAVSRNLTSVWHLHVQLLSFHSVVAWFPWVPRTNIPQRQEVDAARAFRFTSGSSGEGPDRDNAMALYLMNQGSCCTLQGWAWSWLHQTPGPSLSQGGFQA